MSLIDMYRSNVNRKREEIARLTEQKAHEYKRIADLNSKSQSVACSMKSSSSLSTIQSKQKEIFRHQEEIARVEKKIADFEHKLAQKNKELQTELKRLSDEEVRENKKIQAQQAEFQRSQINSINTMTRALRTHEYEITKLKSPPNEITVLFLASNPRDQAQLSLDEEVRSINEMILKAKHRDSVKLESRWAVRPNDILQSMNELEPTIVHFSGHGSDSDELVLMDNQQNTKLVSMGSIVQAMSVSNDNLQLVFFNTCYSNNQAEAIVKHINFAIGMKKSISDEAARIFASQFYSSISFGLSVLKSFDQAKAALLLEGISEEETPELFVKAGLNANEISIVGNFG